MEMLEPSKINKLNNFIAGWYIDNKICDDLITYFKNSPNKKPGVLETMEVKNNFKTSTDLAILPFNTDEIIKKYVTELHKVLKEYKKKYSFCDEVQPQWGITEGFNIQKYEPQEGFLKYHTERSGLKTSLRHLVFMTYLNDIDDGGQTEFYYQKLNVKPEKGLTLIWSADWTFTHKGIASPTQTKYITTGWFSYIFKGEKINGRP